MDPKPSADGELVASIRTGDAKGLDAVYQRYSRPVYSLALRVLGEPSLAEDVTQEVFLKLWRQPESYDPQRGALSSWLLSVTHNRAIDVLRRRRSRDERSLSDGAGVEDSLPDEGDDPSELAGLAETATAVRRAMTEIPESQRRPIEMAFFQGKTHRLAETATAVRRAMTEIPESQRRPIEMAFFQGKTHLEIAEELGEPLGTTKTRIRLGMRKLRQLLGAEGLGALE